MDTNVLIALISSGSFAAGTIVSAIISHFTSRAVREAEERKILYDMAARLAVEQWKLEVEHTDRTNAQIEAAGGIMNMPTGSRDIRIPAPQIAGVASRIVRDMRDSARLPPKRGWISRFWGGRAQQKGEGE